MPTFYLDNESYLGEIRVLDGYLTVFQYGTEISMTSSKFRWRFKIENPLNNHI